MSEAEKKPLSIRAHARAAFVLFHVLAISVAAIPAPTDALNPSTWEVPGIKLQVAEWARRLGTDPETLQKKLVALATDGLAVREKLVAPFDPYVHEVGCLQIWTMFAGGDRFPTRFQLQARRANRGAAWETLFEERSSAHSWHASFFDHDRVRGALQLEAWPRYGGDYAATCRYVAREIFAEDASFGSVRCRFVRQRTPSADEVRRGVEYEPTYELPYEVTRSDVGR